ncbi:MAG TPA: radical SAM family heme chaperone HemW [Terriglobales bacterium]|nr:radical SAM family heme chaperone HemW [Terriglobales bacterium]
MGLGVYLAVPFCRSKCSYCNFASQVFAPARYQEYCDLLAREVALAATSDNLSGAVIDTIYWGGGTPSLLSVPGWQLVVTSLKQHFSFEAAAEHTVEAAPGSMSDEIIAAWVAAGVNRVSLGVQSFNDVEARSVGRLHTRATILADIARLRAAGISNLNLDLIAGLPHQTEASWRYSLEVALSTGAPHISVYMLEVDTDSRLGTELLAGGVRYHAHAVPDDDFIADAYELARETLNTAGCAQYEISNFAHPGFESRHNLRYWTRLPYLGLGVDAHSFVNQRRFANPDTLDAYQAPLRDGRLPRDAGHIVTDEEAAEEAWFLGLRLNRGVAYRADPRVEQLRTDGLLAIENDRILLTPRGRLLSNQVFAAFITREPRRRIGAQGSPFRRRA